MASIQNWMAQTTSEETVGQESAPRLFAPVPRPADLPESEPFPIKMQDERANEVKDLTLWSERTTIRAVINPARGERIRIFTKRGERLNLATGQHQSLSAPVVELQVGGEKVRLYVTDDGIILSTEEFNF